MKNKEQHTKKAVVANNPSTSALFAQLSATEKQLDKACAAYDQKVAAYEEAEKQHSDKITLRGLLAAVKIAKFTYKIKRIEHKLAKTNWKAASKADKKAVQSAGKETVKAKPKKANHKAPKDTANKGKGSPAANNPSQPKIAKKKTESKA